jgi:hypothetical protein
MENVVEKTRQDLEEHSDEQKEEQKFCTKHKQNSKCRVLEILIYQ